MVVDRSGTPLRELGAPVVSVFSTGVLEAAAAGLPAWVLLRRSARRGSPEFWERYGMSRWGMRADCCAVAPGGRAGRAGGSGGARPRLAEMCR